MRHGKLRGSPGEEALERVSRALAAQPKGWQGWQWHVEHSDTTIPAMFLMGGSGNFWVALAVASKFIFQVKKENTRHQKKVAGGHICGIIFANTTKIDQHWLCCMLLAHWNATKIQSFCQILEPAWTQCVLQTSDTCMGTTLYDRSTLSELSTRPSQSSCFVDDMLSMVNLPWNTKDHPSIRESCNLGSSLMSCYDYPGSPRPGHVSCCSPARGKTLSHTKPRNIIRL